MCLNNNVPQIAYEATIMEVYNANSLTQAPNFNAYEVEDAETTKDLADFALANAIYCALAEGYAAEVTFPFFRLFDVCHHGRRKAHSTAIRCRLVVTLWTTHPRTPVK